MYQNIICLIRYELLFKNDILSDDKMHESSSKQDASELELSTAETKWSKRLGSPKRMVPRKIL